MPNDNLRDQTDGNPDTEYEDTQPQIRTGFIVDPKEEPSGNSDRLRKHPPSTD